MARIHPLIPALCLAGCALPPVNLSTTEPIKVDINVRLDVYQHGEKKPETAVAATPDTADAEIEGRRRNRMGDIQLFKNSRIVGENRLGLLEVRNLPPAEFGDYVTRVVEEENADRSRLMERIAADKSLTIVDVQKQQAALAQTQAFNGEWIEIPARTGGFAWVQKGSE